MDNTSVKRRRRKHRAQWTSANGTNGIHQSTAGGISEPLHDIHNVQQSKRHSRSHGGSPRIGHGTEGHNHKVIQTTDVKKETYVALMPKKTIWLVWLVTLVSRVYIISRKDSGWILHPDEVFQSIEVAHGLVYGYGFRPYEYLPPPSVNATSAVEKQEAATGMYSLRSFLYPKLFAAVLWSTETIGISANPFYVCRLFHTIVAAHLPVAVYSFILALIRNNSHLAHDTALLCAIFVAFSENISVLGTHSLVNSFLAPVLFAALAMFIRMLNSVDKCYNDQHALSKSKNALKSQSTHKDVDMNGNGTFISVKNGDEIPAKGVLCNTGCQNGTNLHQTTNETSASKTIGHTFTCFFGDYLGLVQSPNNTSMSQMNQNTAPDKNTPTNDVPNINSLLVKYTQTAQRFIVGMIFGLLIYIRVDTIIIIGVVSLVVCVSNIRRALPKRLCILLVQVAIGTLSGLIIGGLEDKRSYGQWFLSPYQWFCFNVKTGLAGILFGSQNLLFYVTEIYFKENLSMMCLVFVFVYILGSALVVRSDDIGAKGTLVKLILTLSSLLIIYSVQEHKELRFVHNLLVLNSTIMGITLTLVMKELMVNILRRCAVFVVLALLIAKLYVGLPIPHHMSNAKFAYLDNWDSNYINECLEYVGRQPEATGVFLDRSIHVTGGYSVLHKNIPIFSLVHYEFQEFGASTKSLTGESSWIGGKPSEITRLNRISNFITTENSPLLLKYIIEQTEYNYLVVKSSRDVLTIGYEEVFSSGTMRVLKRTFDRDEEAKLQNIASSIPLGQNATILEYEGSWLHTFGLHEKAIERLMYALKLGNPRIRTYQIVSLSYSALGLMDKAQDMYEECLKIHGNTCSYPQTRVVLHSEYNLDLNLNI